jgi:hypothetical protein
MKRAYSTHRRQEHATISCNNLLHKGSTSYGRLSHCLDGTIKMDFKKITMGGCGLDSCDSGQGPVAGSSQHGNEHLGFS